MYSWTLTRGAEQRVASALLTRGRLNLGQIVQFTSLKTRTVRASVIVLFQQNLLWRSSADEEKEILEFNVDECLTRMRFGRYVWWAEKKCGVLVSFSILYGPLAE
jgi:DNA-directed RNA polymerase III subunit RPC3